jgi:hypothetical protein
MDNLVVIDKRSRFPAVEIVKSTSSGVTTKALMKIFSDFGIPRIIYSDNGPPFQSKEFSLFCSEMGIKHHRVTPLHPRANGEAESFMKMLNMIEQITNSTNKDYRTAIVEMLMGYRSTPHSATGKTPYEIMMNRNIKTKLDYLPKLYGDEDKEIDERDAEYKMRIKSSAENRNTKPHQYRLGDFVLVKQFKTNKWSTPYQKEIYSIMQINGSQILCRRLCDGKTLIRDASMLKPANLIMAEKLASQNKQEEINEDMLNEIGVQDIEAKEEIQVEANRDIVQMEENEVMITQGEPQSANTKTRPVMIQEQQAIYTNEPRPARVWVHYICN